MRSKVESSEKVVVAKLNIVDLADSERTKKTGTFLVFFISFEIIFYRFCWIALIEASYINKSLTFLE